MVERPRPTVMPKALIALSLLLAVAACGTETAATQPPPDETTKTITVSFTYHDDPHHPIYLERAVPEYRLIDHSGTLIATKLAPSDTPVRFAGLSRGTYRLEPALRPCDGNCDYLDPRTD